MLLWYLFIHRYIYIHIATLEYTKSSHCYLFIYYCFTYNSSFIGHCCPNIVERSSTLKPHEVHCEVSLTRRELFGCSRNSRYFRLLCLNAFHDRGNLSSFWTLLSPSTYREVINRISRDLVIILIAAALISWSRREL